jgi:hypothetical protein
MKDTKGDNTIWIIFGAYILILILIGLIEQIK